MLDTFYKCEYENLRKKTKKEKRHTNLRICKFMDITFELLRDLGWKDEDILSYYNLKQKGKI